ncbi:hypothetical protein H257_07074 [Aphanomyces astaci]|uniref:Secreted protein n=1 Tax=Aphanomyces astaci TaxID=112090 RepID=W4GLE0_APHAT|nr:hypothetical protein H257_07074 [Aphanomyces astaci]ETV79859.1 hypothetical protein H257_07074 [Aphanomyces astaci]|eukprot:XP_009830795.1 hypothetical protein H257_07074 [Aphanomyces astaci]
MCCDDLCSAIFCGALCGWCCAVAAEEDRRFRQGYYAQPVMVRTVQPVPVLVPRPLPTYRFYPQGTYVQQGQGQPQYGGNGHVPMAKPVPGHISEIHFTVIPNVLRRPLQCHDLRHPVRLLLCRRCLQQLSAPPTTVIVQPVMVSPPHQEHG